MTFFKELGHKYLFDFEITLMLPSLLREFGADLNGRGFVGVANDMACGYLPNQTAEEMAEMLVYFCALRVSPDAQADFQRAKRVKGLSFELGHGCSDGFD